MGEQPRTHQALAALATEQYGVVSAVQLESIGYSGSAISRAAAAGRLHRLHRGVYAVGHRDLSAHGHALAAVFACDPGAFLSHISAAWLWGLVRAFPAAIHVTARTRRHAKPAVRLHFGTIAEEDCAVHEGIPVTAIPRTLLDLAADLSSYRLERCIDRAEQSGLFDLVAVDELLQRIKGHRGTRRLGRAIALYRPSAFTRSGLERRFLELVREAGLPRPSMNFFVEGFEIDAYWPDLRFGVELDVFETHGTPAAFERDRLRQEDLKLKGIELDRVTGVRIDLDPDDVIRRVAALLQQRRKEIQ